MKKRILVKPDGNYFLYMVQVRSWRTFFIWATVHEYCVNGQDQAQAAINYARNYKGRQVIKI